MRVNARRLRLQPRLPVLLARAGFAEAQLADVADLGGRPPAHLRAVCAASYAGRTQQQQLRLRASHTHASCVPGSTMMPTRSSSSSISEHCCRYTALSPGAVTPGTKLSTAAHHAAPQRASVFQRNAHAVEHAPVLDLRGPCVVRVARLRVRQDLERGAHGMSAVGRTSGNARDARGAARRARVAARRTGLRCGRGAPRKRGAAAQSALGLRPCPGGARARRRGTRRARPRGWRAATRPGAHTARCRSGPPPAARGEGARGGGARVASQGRRKKAARAHAPRRAPATTGLPRRATSRRKACGNGERYHAAKRLRPRLERRC